VSRPCVAHCAACSILVLVGIAMRGLCGWPRRGLIGRTKVPNLVQFICRSIKDRKHTAINPMIKLGVINPSTCAVPYKYRTSAHCVKDRNSMRYRPTKITARIHACRLRFVVIEGPNMVIMIGVRSQDVAGIQQLSHQSSTTRIIGESHKLPIL
jgi:hypothetical protein